MVINLDISEEIKKIFQELGKKLPKEAEQHTNKLETKKGYDTDGYGYQFGVNQFNALLFDRWGFSWEILKEIEGKYPKSGFLYWEITVKMNIWILDKKNARSCVGGHISNTYFDALKGAITNGFKKTAAFWGSGRQAYEGTMDDDNKPYPGENQDKIGKNPNSFQKSFQKPNTNSNSNNPSNIFMILLGMFNKLGLRTVTQDDYISYLLGKYKIKDLMGLDSQKVLEQKKILKGLALNAKNRAKFELHLGEMKEKRKLGQKDKAQSMRTEIREIMKRIYGENQTEINRQISLMTDDDTNDLDKMEINKLEIVLDLTKVLLGDYLEAKKAA